MGLADWWAVPPWLNLLAFWEEGGLVKKTSPLLTWVNSWLHRLSEPALEVTPYLWQAWHPCQWRVSDITVGQPKHQLHTRPSL